MRCSGGFAALACCLAFGVLAEGLPGRFGKVPVVQTGLGEIRGSVMETRSGVKFFAFRGIRYAEPPTGSLRFRAPWPISAWNGTLDATRDGPMCVQPAIDEGDVSEDCLRLNVYSRAIPDELIRIRPADVLVYLHPGGFYAFSGQSHNNAGPQYLMDRDIVLVTINYRLGSLGFMATGTAHSPGNAGLKDQVLALKWIRDHISAFGGNPNSVTLMGYSAGAFSITLHMISPMSKGLFHRAIVMSGSTTSQVLIPSHQLELAQKQAILLDCPIISTPKMIDCLRKKPARDFASTLESMFMIAWNPILLYKPVIEPDFGQERFLTQDPNEAYLKGEFVKIPIIAGITKDEFAGPAISFLRNDSLRKELDEGFEALAPVLFLYERGTKESARESRELRARFLGNGTLSLERSLEGLSQLFSDSLIGFAVHRFVQLVARHTTVYQYKFSYVGRYSFLYYPPNGTTPFGAVHHDDLLYLFSVPSKAPLFNETDPENGTVERLTRMWTAFARTGDPNKAEMFPSPNWKPVSGDHDNYLVIGDGLSMEEGLYAERYAFWDKLFPLPSKW